MKVIKIDAPVGKESLAFLDDIGEREIYSYRVKLLKSSHFYNLHRTRLYGPFRSILWIKFSDTCFSALLFFHERM